MSERLTLSAKFYLRYKYCRAFSRIIWNHARVTHSPAAAQIIPCVTREIRSPLSTHDGSTTVPFAANSEEKQSRLRSNGDRRDHDVAICGIGIACCRVLASPRSPI